VVRLMRPSVFVFVFAAAGLLASCDNRITPVAVDDEVIILKEESVEGSYKNEKDPDKGVDPKPLPIPVPPEPCPQGFEDQC